MYPSLTPSVTASHDRLTSPASLIVNFSPSAIFGVSKPTYFVIFATSPLPSAFEVVTLILFIPSVSNVTFSVTMAPAEPLPLFNTVLPTAMLYETLPESFPPPTLFVGNLNDTFPLRLPLRNSVASAVAAAGAVSARASGRVSIVTVLSLVNSPTSSRAAVDRFTVYSFDVPR